MLLEEATKLCRIRKHLKYGHLDWAPISLYVYVSHFVGLGSPKLILNKRWEALEDISG